MNGRKGITTSQSIAGLRGLAGWNQAETAERAGISAPTLGAVEQEQRPISMPVARKLAALFGITIDDLISGGWAHVYIRPDADDATESKDRATDAEQAA